MRVLTDFHHSSLLRSLNMLFGDRFGMQTFRPIGMDWFINDYWKINDNRETAKQYLSLEQVPPDGTMPLNQKAKDVEKGVYYCYDGGSQTINRACTFKFFIEHKFDYLICSMPQHIEPFKKLKRYYQPQAKIIVQIGNEWPQHLYKGNNVLASIKPREVLDTNIMFYHQEFDTQMFRPKFGKRERNIYCFVNVLQEKPQDYNLFLELEKLMPAWNFKIFGGQNRDGNLTQLELAKAMRECAFAFHCKTGGDGYGHILWNNAFSATPIITRYSDYADRLGDCLLTKNTSIFVDNKTPKQIAWEIEDRYQRNSFADMGREIYKLATENCNFDKEAEDIKKWLKTLK